MSNRVKNKVVTICFLSFTIGLFIINILAPDEEFSVSERRSLKIAPTFTFNKLLSSELSKEFDRYTADQFILRDFFRSIKAISSYYVFRNNDNNGIYFKDGYISKIEYPLNQNSLLNASNKFNEIYLRYFNSTNVNAYYSIIPDKNYFLTKDNNFLSLNYSEMLDILSENIEYFNYIDLFRLLSIEDYYKTDIHWRQDKLMYVADKLMMGMNSEKKASDFEYTEKKLYPFYGSYYGQLAINTVPDNLTYLTNDMLENTEVYDYESKVYSSVYMPGKFSGMDPYDVFLSGARALITIDNPNAETNKELILFRDSFGSSIAPLLVGGYSKVTLVDLRYISADLLDNYIDFTNEYDVLFLYSTFVINNSYMLR